MLTVAGIDKSFVVSLVSHDILPTGQFLHAPCNVPQCMVNNSCVIPEVVWAKYICLFNSGEDELKPLV